MITYNNYKICIKSDERGINYNTVVIIKINLKNPKIFVEIKTASNGKFVYLKQINEFHKNFGETFKTLEEAEIALQEIFKSKPFKF